MVKGLFPFGNILLADDNCLAKRLDTSLKEMKTENETKLTSSTATNEAKIIEFRNLILDEGS